MVLSAEGRAPAVSPDARSGAAPARQARRRRYTVPWWFLAPAAIFYGFVVLAPSARGAWYAFTDWDGLSPDWSFVGVEQFHRLLDDGAATGAVVNTLLIAVTITVVQNLVGLLLALGVNSRIKSRNVLRVLLFAPAVITPVATGYLWQYLLAPDGAVNRLLGGIGLGALRQDWLGDPDLVIWVVAGVIVWQFSGYSMVIFLAGLQGVPADVLEAAAMDGAGGWRTFWHIVRPMLAPAITINLMLSIIGGLKLFDQVWAMTGGGPGNASETMSTLIYKNAIQFNEFAYSIAMAVVLTIFVAIISGIQYRGLARQKGAQG